MPKEDTQFKPGQSGNPGGRPKKLAADVRRAVSNEDLIDFQRTVLYLDQEGMSRWGITAKDVTLRERQQAHMWLTERGHGKAAPLPTVEDSDPLEMGEADKRIAEILDELAPKREAKTSGRTEAPGVDMRQNGVRRETA